MSRSLNKVLLIGNVGAEPECRTTPSGTRLASFSLATNRTWNDKNGHPQEKTEWHRVKAFGKVVEVIERYVHKGDRIYIEGRIEYSTVEGDANTPTRYFTDVIANDMVMLGGNTGPVEAMASAAKQASADPFADDPDLPF